MTLTKLLHACNEAEEHKQGHEVGTLRAVAAQLKLFAGVQVRNVATLAGNIATGSPISDLNPIWVAAGAEFVVQRAGGAERRVAAADFFRGYRFASVCASCAMLPRTWGWQCADCTLALCRKVDLEPGEVLTHVHVPWTRQGEVVAAFKQSHRREDDIALVNAGMRLRCAQAAGGSWRVEEAVLAYGGVAACVVIAKHAAGALVEQQLSQAAVKVRRTAMRLPRDLLHTGAPVTLPAARYKSDLTLLQRTHAGMQSALEAVSQDITVPETAPGGMGAYRSALAKAFLFKFLVKSAAQLAQESEGPAPEWLGDAERSAIEEAPHQAARGVQFHAEAQPDAIVGQSVKHRAADLQVSAATTPFGYHASCALSCRGLASFVCPTRCATLSTPKTQSTVAANLAACVISSCGDMSTGIWRGKIYRRRAAAGLLPACGAGHVQRATCPHQAHRCGRGTRNARRCRLLGCEGRARRPLHRAGVPRRGVLCQRRGHGSGAGHRRGGCGHA